MANKVYIGTRNSGPGSDGVSVVVVEDGTPRDLPPRLDLRELSPTGLEWGYGNDGPAQLAMAILADATESDDYAVRHHTWFKLEIVSTLPWKGWKLTEERVSAWVRQHHPLE